MSSAFFQKKVDRRSRSAMVAFLQGHERYNTMNSCNRLTSYANNIKLHRLGLSTEQANNAYEMLDTDFWDEIGWPIEEFTTSQEHAYTLGANGRSGGYLVLYQSHRELTGHLSYCPTCGQRNFKKVPPNFQEETERTIANVILSNPNAWRADVYIDQPAIKALSLSDSEKLKLIHAIKATLKDCSAGDACGVCGKPRRNYDVPPSQLSISSQGIDQHEEFCAEDWSMAKLRERVDLVCTFDTVCDAIRSAFIDLLNDFEVVEETKLRPVKVKKLVSRAA
jgi:hypothetical protein